MGNIVRTIAAACGTGIALVASAAEPGPGRGTDRPVVAVLELPDGGFMRGAFAERPEAGRPAVTLAWKSPLFAAPIEFGIDAVRCVRFAGSAGDVPPADAWRCELDGGDTLIGRLKGMDADRLTILPAGDDGQELQVRRAAVARLARCGAGARVLVPGPLEAWQAPGGGWTAVGGRVSGSKAGAIAHLPLELPQRVRYDLELSWNERPDLVIAVAADAMTIQAAARKSSKTTEEFRVELAGDSLLAVRESATADFDKIADIDADTRRLRVVLYVDRDSGRMAVVLPQGDGEPGKKVFDAKLPPRAKPPAGFSLKLVRGDVRIDSLSVSEWTEPEPTTTDRPLPVAEGYDPAAGEFVVRDAAGERRLPAAEVVAVTVRGAAAPQATEKDEGRLQAVFKDGGRVTGSLLAVAGDGVVLDCPALAGPVRCRFARLATLEAAAPGRPPAAAGTAGVLQSVEARVPGSLVNAVDGEGVGWLAAGATGPVRFAAGIPPVRIEFPLPKSGKAVTPTAATPALVYLRTGDSFLSKVLSVDAAGLRVATAAAADTLVPGEAWRAVELTPGRGSTVAREKQTRLLTLPRMQQADPPTHLLRLQSGDYLRGKLLSVDEKVVRFEMLGVVKEFPRADVMRLIWLAPPGGGPRPEIVKPDDAIGLPVQALTADGRRLTFAARSVDGRDLVGRHAVMGPIGIALDSCTTLLVGAAAIAATPLESLPYGQWVLKPADPPRALRPKPGDAAEAEDPAKSPAPVAETVDPGEQQALAAAEAAVAAFDPRCLEMLGELLDAKSAEIRRTAVAKLRLLTGRATRELPFSAADPPDKRRADALRWRQWIARDGLFAELAFPRPVVPQAGLLGRTLVALPGQNAVVEVDDQGRETFRVAAKSAYACDLLPNGHRLVGDGKGVVEYDARGKEIWSKTDLPRAPMSVRRLDNGNTLVAMDGHDQQKSVVLEIDPLGEEVWRWQGDMPGDAARLPDGNTIVALHGANRVVEVDADGKEVWAMNVDDPLRVERLADDTTLVVSGANRGRIYDRQGAEIRDLGEVRDARVAPDGGLLILGMDGVLAREELGKPPLRIQLPEGAGRFRRR